MAEVASAWVSLLPSAAGFGKKLDSQISGDVKSAGKKSGLTFGKLFAAGAGLGIGAKAISFLGDSRAEGREAQKVSALVANAIKTTGGAANVTAKQVDRLATSISRKTGIDDEQIATASSLILTFKNISNEGKGVDAIFNRTTKAAVDLSAAGFGSVDSAAKQLGKALQDPVRGVTALGRAGVTFSQNQKDQIKNFVETGNLLKAQKLILAEVNTQVGGAAAATATASDKAAVAAGNLKEQIGTAMIPIVDRLANTFTTKVAPAVSGFIRGMQTGRGAGGQFAAVLVAIGTTTLRVANFLRQNSTAVKTFIGIVGTAIAITKAWRAAQIALNFVLTANPIGIVVVAIAALAAGLVIAYKRSETFRNVVNGAFEAVKSGAQSVANFITKTIPAAFNNVVSFVKSIPSKLAAIFTGAASIFYNAGVQLMAQLAAGITAKIGDAINAAKSGLDRLKGLLPGSPIKWGPLKNWNNGGAGKRLMELVERGITQATPKTVKAAQSAFEKIGDALRDERDRLQGILDGLKSDFNAIKDAVSGAFVGDLFNVSATEGKTVGQNFIEGLMGKKAELTNLLASFKTLQGWGVSPAFLTQLFSSGNGALITELAGMGQAGAINAANLFGDVTSLGAQLGQSVAQNDPVAGRIDETNRLLGVVSDQLSYLGSDIGKELNQAASKAARSRKGRKGSNQ